jgi:hypothetical protein
MSTAATTEAYDTHCLGLQIDQRRFPEAQIGERDQTPRESLRYGARRDGKTR